jgi:uncharacterized protein YeaO (DUF488 family)
MAVMIKRVYDPASGNDGYRVLVDRLWPRGLSKEKAEVDLWLKEIGPSTELRKWFDHDPAKWKDFCSRYRKELKHSAALADLIVLVRKHSRVTLLYGSKDPEFNQAVALIEMIKEKI